ncbi:NAD-binding protein [Streptomyces sp. NPDC050504]|uniref:potassium channel family protein n=1 Tax=Streptomyces sp. NPDC050504 TaxID=3365618 RepID=UPI0037A1DA60
MGDHGFVSTLPQQSHTPSATATTDHMIVCGDDALAHRLAAELRYVYGERVVLVVPPGRDARTAQLPLSARGMASALFGRMSAAVGRVAVPGGPAGAPAAGPGTPGGPAGSPFAAAPGANDSLAGVREVEVVEAAEPTDEVLADVGAARAAALALVYDSDETNIRAALTARRLNPRIRLVIRLYNRKLGQHLEALLDQAAAVSSPGTPPSGLDTSTTVLSDADTAAPALAATAVAGTSKVVQADGLLLRAAEHRPGTGASRHLCALAVLTPTGPGPVPEGQSAGPAEGPQLLPDAEQLAQAGDRSTLVLEAVGQADQPSGPARSLALPPLPIGQLFSRRLRFAVAGLGAVVLGLALASWWALGDHPLHATYLTLLDIFAIGEPAVDQPTSRQVIQLLSGLAGLLLLPLLVAAVLEGLGAFRTASALRRPPRGLSGHVVLLGLGKVGTRVLARLHELDIPVVCVEEDPDARGIPLARRLRVPTVIGDVTQEGVLEAAKIHRARALLALTSVDTTNLEAALYARSVKPDVQVSLRLFDDAFATAVYRTLRTAHPRAITRSRSVSYLAAPSFAGAMMGRRILGAVPVERKMLLLAAVDVAGNRELEGRTVAEAFRPGAWRVLALDTTPPDERRAGLSARAGASSLTWDLHPGQLLGPRDRVVVAATRRGLAELTG